MAVRPTPRPMRSNLRSERCLRSGAAVTADQVASVLCHEALLELNSHTGHRPQPRQGRIFGGHKGVENGAQCAQPSSVLGITIFRLCSATLAARGQEGGVGVGMGLGCSHRWGHMDAGGHRFSAFRRGRPARVLTRGTWPAHPPDEAAAAPRAPPAPQPSPARGSSGLSFLMRQQRKGWQLRGVRRPAAHHAGVPPPPGGAAPLPRRERRAPRLDAPRAAAPGSGPCQHRELTSQHCSGKCSERSVRKGPRKLRQGLGQVL